MKTLNEMFHEVIMNRVLKAVTDDIVGIDEYMPLVEQGWDAQAVLNLLNSFDTALAADENSEYVPTLEHANIFCINHAMDWLRDSLESFGSSHVDYFDVAAGEFLLSFDSISADSGLIVHKCVRVAELITTNALECKVHYMYEHEIKEIAE